MLDFCRYSLTETWGCQHCPSNYYTRAHLQRHLREAHDRTGSISDSTSKAKSSLLRQVACLLKISPPRGTASPHFLETILSQVAALSPRTASLRGTTYATDVVLNGIKIEASADTGASFNIMSKSLADSMNLKPEPGTGRDALLPSGQKIYSLGRVQMTGRFTDEKEEFNLSCMVVEKTTQPLVLGREFLRLTEAFQKHKHRLKKVISTVTGLRLNLVGEEQETLGGYLNGSRCMAVPDSGSDIMVLSGAYAEARGFSIRRGRQYKQRVEYIDGSIRHTDGIIENMEWQFRKNERPIRCDFHVINNLPVDAILSGAMIDEYDVFTKYDDLIIQGDSSDDHCGIYNIRLAEKCRAEISKLETSFQQDSEAPPFSITRRLLTKIVNSDQAFCRSMVERERARRDEIRDRIEGLLAHERQHELESERNRQAHFDQEWRKHRQRVAASGQSHQAVSRDPPPLQAGASQTTPSGPGGNEHHRFWRGVRHKRLYPWNRWKR